MMAMMYVDIYLYILNISDSTLIHEILFLHLNYIIYIVDSLYQYQYSSIRHLYSYSISIDCFINSLSRLLYWCRQWSFVWTWIKLLEYPIIVSCFIYRLPWKRNLSSPIKACDRRTEGMFVWYE